MTNRLRQWIEAIGCAASGEVGARLAQHLGMCASPTTILRRLMALSNPPTGAVSVLGIDDWSFRRGRKFGNLYCSAHMLTTSTSYQFGRKIIVMESVRSSVSTTCK